tara:strand:- start:5859 stop:7139 length:1281 start_codon:yes stop_codon:yes gene_type:complete
MKVFFFVLALVSFESYAEYSSMGEVALEYRQFKDDDSKTTEDTGLAVFSRLESRYEDDFYSHVLRGFARVDSKESSRDLIWVEDAYASYFLDQEKLWRLSAGYKIYNWTGLEAFRPNDTVNSQNYDAPLEKPEKRGELGVELEIPYYEGALTLFVFPRTEAPHFPGAASRLGLGTNIAEPLWVDGLEASSDRWHPQYAARLTQLIMGADVSIHYLQHFDRLNPIIGTSDYSIVGMNAIPNQGVSSMNVPHYFQVAQYGASMQMPIFDAWLFKLEGAKRSFEKDLSVLTASGLQKPVDHSEVALGLEYATSHIDGSDSTLFFEAVKIFGTEEAEAEALSAFQNDVFIGLRHVRNDIMGTEFLLSAIFDLKRTHEKLYNFQFSRRLSDVWKVGATLRVFDAPKQSATPVGLEVLDQDHHISLSLSRFF